MRKLGILLTLVASLAFTATASADAMIWFEAAGSTSSGAGETLIMPACGTYEVTMWCDTDTMYAYSVDLCADLCAGGPEGCCAAVSNVQYLVGSPWFSDPVVTGGCPVILDNAGEYDLFQTTPVVGLKALMSFTLSCGLPDPPCCPCNIYAGIGQQKFAPAGSMITFGPNDPVTGDVAGGCLPLPVITCIPEPATIALLGFGVLALIRRR